MTARTAPHPTLPAGLIVAGRTALRAAAAAVVALNVVLLAEALVGESPGQAIFLPIYFLLHSYVALLVLALLPAPIGWDRLAAALLAGEVLNRAQPIRGPLHDLFVAAGLYPDLLRPAAVDGSATQANPVFAILVVVLGLWAVCIGLAAWRRTRSLQRLFVPLLGMVVLAVGLAYHDVIAAQGLADRRAARLSAMSAAVRLPPDRFRAACANLGWTCHSLHRHEPFTGAAAETNRRVRAELAALETSPHPFAETRWVVSMGPVVGAGAVNQLGVAARQDDWLRVILDPGYAETLARYRTVGFALYWLAFAVWIIGGGSLLALHTTRLARGPARHHG